MNNISRLEEIKERIIALYCSIIQHIDEFFNYKLEIYKDYNVEMIRKTIEQQKNEIIQYIREHLKNMIADIELKIYDIKHGKIEDKKSTKEGKGLII